MADEKDRVENSKEFRRFYNTLQAVQIAAIDYVREGKTDDEMISRATEVTSALAGGMKGVGASNKSNLMNIFDNNLCWDPVTRQFVACPDTTE